MPSRKGKLHRQTGWNTTVAAQMTARERRKKKVRAEVRGGWRMIIIIIILFTVGKRHV